MPARLPLALLTATAALALPAAAHAAGPNLAVSATTNAPATLQEGAGFTVRDTTVNRGAARAARTTTRYYLSTDPKASLKARRRSKANPRTSPQDILLTGARNVPALAAGKAAPARRAIAVQVPVGTRAGRYTLLACADDRGAVAEAREDDNCRAAGRPVKVAGAPDSTSVQALSDLFDMPTPQEDLRTLSTMGPVACAAKIPALPVMTTDQAIRSLRATLQAQAGAPAMAAFKASPQYKDPVALQGAAVAAVATGNPGGALVALLRAAELQPTRAANLRNAATVASAIGQPNQALALLDGAARRDDGRLAPMGIGAPAATQAIRGQALGLLGRWDEAKGAFTAALAGSPLLSEAHTGLATAGLCQGDPKVPAASVVDELRDGRVRRTPVPPVDASHGKAQELRNVVLPALPVNAAAMVDYAKADNAKVSGEVVANVEKLKTIQARVHAAEATLSRAEDRARDAIMNRVYKASSEPDLAAQQQQVLDLIGKADDVQREFWAPGQTDSRYGVMADEATEECEGARDFSACRLQHLNDKCRPALKGAHAEWLDHMSQAFRVAQAFHRAHSLRMSGYAAHIADPDLHANVLAEIEQSEIALYSNFEGEVLGWTHYADMYREECVEPVAVTPPADLPSAGPAQGDPCAPALKKVNVVIDLKIVKVKVNCEKITLSGKIDSGLPWLSAFGEVTYNAKAGQITVFAGSKGELSGYGVKGDFKSGVYIKVDQEGIADVGWRVGPSISFGDGPVEISALKEQSDISFIGVDNPVFGGQ